MLSDLSTLTLALILGVIFFGGFVKGVAGFGEAIASTAILSLLLDPATAVVLMILPMLATSLSLVTDLGRDDLTTCAKRFWPFVAAAVAGTLVGTALLGRIPTALLALALGIFTLSYVLTTQPWVVLPGESWVRETCFTTHPAAKVSLGLVSGVIFGTSNIAVQVVAYLDSLSLDHKTFTGVLAMILVGVSSVRVVAAWVLGLYQSTDLMFLSMVFIVPSFLGLKVGRRLQKSIPARYQTAGVLLLLLVIGVRLTMKGAQGI